MMSNRNKEKEVPPFHYFDLCNILGSDGGRVLGNKVLRQWLVRVTFIAAARRHHGHTSPV